MSEDHLGCQRHNGDTGYLADIGNSTAGTRIYLDHIDIFAAYDKLDIDQADDMKRSCQLLRIIRNGGSLPYHSVL